MKKLERGIAWILAALLLLAAAGCAEVEEVPQTTAPMVPETTQATVPPPTAPADGNPEDVTCKGSYSSEDPAPDGVAAVITPGPEDAEEITLTNSQLQVWYWMEVAAYRASGREGPDYAQSLDTQLCDLDDTALTWQQYFLQKALDTWHTSQALVQMARDEGLPTEEAYQPNRADYEKYLTGMPAAQYLQGYSQSYSPNRLHQDYLDGIGPLLEELAREKGFGSAGELAGAAACAREEDMQEYARVYNLAYMYFTNRSYFMEPDTETVAERAAEFADLTGRTVDIRHILLIPEDSGEEAWTACEETARGMLEELLAMYNCSEARFAELSHANSMDRGSAPNGGAYRNLRAGQLVQPLDAWCFDEARQPGDTAVIRSDCGWHILWFSGSRAACETAAREVLILETAGALLEEARMRYPMETDYSAIVLEDGDSSLLCPEELLYPDVAHERYPDAPLYLQQDYPNSYYGEFFLTTHGCGISTMAMLASYMTDEALTPPELASRYGRYCYPSGTDGSLFVAEPAVLGFYLLDRVFDYRAAVDAMEEGYPVVCVQREGLWTRAGHFLLLQEVKENGKLIIRDSNIYNYARLEGHRTDEFGWDTVIPDGTCYWIYDHKLTRIGACSRCGEDTEGVAFGMFTTDYTCEKCIDALQRRNDFLDLCS